MKHICTHLSLLLLACSSAYATDQAVCDDKLTAALNECERIVGSLRYDKAGQARVFASDGSEYTAGQAQWMKGELRLINADCVHGDAVSAARRLAEVQELIRAHHGSV